MHIYEAQKKLVSFISGDFIFLNNAFM